VKTLTLILCRTLMLAAVLVVTTLTLSACGAGQESSTSKESQQALNKLPTAQQTKPAMLPTAEATAPTSPVASPSRTAEYHSLVNASTEEISKLAINYVEEKWRIAGRVKPEIVLARSITLDELTDLGLGNYSFSSIEVPPMTLVIIKGEFNFSGQPRRVRLAAVPQINYVALVYDLWSGVPTVEVTSLDGSKFRKALNDPNLPTDEALLSSPDDRLRPSAGPQAHPTAPAHLHYGDTVPSIRPASGDLVHEASFGSWSYTASRKVEQVQSPEGVTVTHDQLYAVVSYDGSVTANYVEMNKQEARKLAQGSGKVEVWLTFNRYLSAAEFGSFAAAHKMQVGTSYLRAINQNPKPIYASYYTIQITPSQNTMDVLPQVDLDTKLSALNDTPEKQIGLAGVYVTHGWIDAVELNTLLADPALYYVDVTADLVRIDLAKAGVAGADQAVIVAHPEFVFASMVEQPHLSK